MNQISLAAARVNAELTQEQLGEILGVTGATVNNWEHGRSEPTISQLRKISELSKISMDFIFVPCKSK